MLLAAFRPLHATAHHATVPHTHLRAVEFNATYERCAPHPSHALSFCVPADGCVRAALHAALCVAQLARWQSVSQYATVLHALHTDAAPAPRHAAQLGIGE